METVFDAGNNIEAHMIVNLLERSGVDARIMGEHLQGAVGELPAHGNIRVVVDKKDAQIARELISKWEQTLVSAEPEDIPDKSNKLRSSVFPFLLGVIAASAILLWTFNTPFTTDTADYNRDGKTDEWIYWHGDIISQIDVDRNHDGKIDSVFTFSPRDFTEKREFDNDFNGTFESVTTYRYDQPYVDEVDLNDNGQTDHRYQYTDGVLSRVDMFVPGTRTIRKSQTYEFGTRLTEARWDSDKDGVLDTLITYGPYEEELSRSPIPVDE